jgi:hypothetical protein
MSVDALKNVLLAIAGEGLAHANQTIERRDKRIAELEAEVARLRASNSNSAEFDGIRGAASAAGTEKDAERLDWLERTNQTFCGNYSNTGFRAIGSSIWHGTLREAIDGAMQKDAAIEAHNARSPSCGS